MRKIYIFFITVLLLTLSICICANAEQIFRKDNDVHLRIFCTNNGTYCSSSTICNGSVISPTGIVVYSNVNMTTEDYAIFNLTINSTMLNESGEYQFSAFCNDNGNTKADAFVFKVTPSGIDPSSAQGLMFIALFIMSVFLFCLCLYLSFAIDGNNQYDIGGNFLKVNFNKYIKIGLGFMAYLFFEILVYFAWQLSRQFLVIDIATSLLRTFFIALEIFTIPLIIVCAVLVFIRAILDMRIDKLAKRGLRPYGK